jgi:hypothetical protein
MTRALPFTEAPLARAMKPVEAAGLHDEGVRVTISIPRALQAWVEDRAKGKLHRRRPAGLSR